ncbi:terminase small subunit [Acetobacter sacchari]|uniref:Terminase small subunit n=1 Tax=Acetobacter sacchari TaxID=2661687 RepID=A0ABS3M0X6_9PROT|nr:terminase small subunit [Acetobacter sacchari]MBO1361788.1 terminase small subunit [Acetobacter sacchari]
MADLTPKQRRFVEVYLSNGENAAEAYRVAYSRTCPDATARANGSRLLKNANIVHLISRAQRAAKKRTDRIVDRYAINKEKVLLELARIGFADVTDVVNVVEDGETRRVEIKATADLSEDVRRAISEISETTNESGDRTIKVKQHSKLTALQQISKILGYDKPTPQDDGAVDDMAGDPDPERIDRGESSEGG